MDDGELYKEVIDCFKSTNFTNNEINEIFKILSDVLLIGNIKFKVANDVWNLENKNIYENICTLLSIEAEPLYNELTRKYIKLFFDS